VLIGQVSAACYERMKSRDIFVFEPRGEIEVKGKGKMETYFLTGLREGVTSRTRSHPLYFLSLFLVSRSCWLVFPST
jgi:hypothetical protein